jgi:hypothetical protein
MYGTVKHGNDEAELEHGAPGLETREVRPRHKETIAGFELISHNFLGRG